MAALLPSRTDTLYTMTVSSPISLPAKSAGNLDVPTIQSFEGLRGICAALVVLYHFGLVKSNLIAGSYLFVDVFFVLSGYIMMLNYYQRLVDRRAFMDFLGKRFARLYPLFLFTTFTFLLATKLVAPYLQGLLVEITPAVKAVAAAPAHGLAPADDDSALLKLIAWLTFTSSMGWYGYLYSNYPAWSVSTEFWTYVLFAAAVILARKRLVVVAVGAILISFSVAFYFSVVRHECLVLGECLNVTYDAGFLRCVGGFFLGALSYLLNTRLRQNGRIAWLKHTDVVLLILMLSVVWFSHDIPAVAFAMPAAAAALITVLPLQGAASRLLSHKPLLWLGKMSFAIYLGHATILGAFNPLFQSRILPLPLKIILLVVTLIPFAVVANRMIEEPARKLIVRLLHKSLTSHAPKRAIEPDVVVADSHPRP